MASLSKSQWTNRSYQSELSWGEREKRDIMRVPDAGGITPRRSLHLKTLASEDIADGRMEVAENAFGLLVARVDALSLSGPRLLVRIGGDDLVALWWTIQGGQSAGYR
jgi:hypothetical protein